VVKQVLILSGPIKPFLLDVAGSKHLALKRFFDFVFVNLKDWQSSFGSFSPLSVVFSSIKEFYLCMVSSASSLSQVTIYCSIYSSKMILCIILLFFICLTNLRGSICILWKIKIW